MCPSNGPAAAAGGGGGGGRCQADAVVGKDVVRARAHITVTAIVRNIPVVVLCRLLTERLTTNDFMGESPKKIFREIIFVVSRYGEVGKEVPKRNRHRNSCSVSKHYSYFKTGLVLPG
jgi:hypothetical protein